MSSNNNPNPRLPTLGTPEPVSTQIHVGDRTFEGRDMSTATGIEIYNILPTEGKEEADRLAHVVNKAARVLKAAQKNGVDANELALNWVKTGNDEAAKIKLPPQQQAAIRELEGSGMKFGDIVDLIPGVDTIRGVGAIGGAVGGVGGAAADGLFNGPKRIFNFVTNMGAEGIGFATHYGVGQVDENARAFAAAVVAVRREEEAKRHSQPFIDIPFDGKPSQVWSNPMEYAKAAGGTALDFVAQNFPFADIAIALWNGIKQFADPKEDRLPWAQLVANAQAQIAESKQKHPTDLAHLKERFLERADQEMYGKDGQSVATRLEAMGTIGGIATQGIATAVTAPVITTRDKDGVDTTLDRGEIKKQITPGQRVAAFTNSVVGDGNVVEQGVRTGFALVGFGMAGNGLRGVAEGMIRRGVAAPAKAAEAAEARLKELNGYTDDKGNHIKGKIEIAEAKGPRQHWWEATKHTQEQIDSWKQEAIQMEKVAAEKAAHAQQRAGSANAIVKGAATSISEINGESKVKATWNFSRLLGRGAGDGIAAAGAGVKDVPVGFVKGITEWVTDLPIVKSAGFMEGAGKFLGKTAVGATFLTPVVSGVRAVNDIGAKDIDGAAFHATEAGAVGTMLVAGGLKMGLKRIPLIGPVVSLFEGGNAAVHKDTGGVVRAGTELTTTAAGAGIGAGVGAMFFGVGAIPGAAVGATVGGIVGIFSGMFAEHSYNKSHPKQEGSMRVAQQPTGKLSADPELSAAAVAATERARLAQVAAASSDDIARARMAANRVPFRSGSVAIGANVAALPAASGNVSGPFVG